MRYDRSQTHGLNEPEEILVASTLTKISNRDSYMNLRVLPEFYTRGRGSSTWGNTARSNSPYQRPVKDVILKAPLTSRDKQS